MATIARTLQILQLKNDKLELMLERLTWPLPGHLGAKWLDDVAAAYFSGVLSEDDIATAFVDRYRAHGLDSLRREWQDDPLIASRLPILLDALDAHTDQRYTLSVPVLLAQLEGIIAFANRHRGRFTIETLKKYLEAITLDGSRFQRLAARLAVQTLWTKFAHGMGAPPLSRHAILHGADVGYGTPANSLRAILYFDTIRSALGELER